MTVQSDRTWLDIVNISWKKIPQMCKTNVSHKLFMEDSLSLSVAVKRDR